ncbi:phytoene desaturase family protein [Symmachiella dynata]|nr:NAD(P)/FAD-dependent oxidoreductase [Symmachiella dynata]
MHYDTVIIGAGMSGLAAGIRLAYYGQSVCVLERHTTIGGLNSFYRLRNRNYDVGMHAVTNFAPPGSKVGPLSRVLRQLRFRWDDFDLRPQVESLVAFGETRLRFSNELQLFVDQVADAFPAQIDGFQKLLQRIDAHDDLPLDQQHLSARQVMGESITDPQLIDMILCPIMFYGSASPRDMDFHQFVIMFKSIFHEGFCRPLQGIRPILKALVRKYKSQGGELKLRAGVASIQLDGERAVGVVLDDGTEITADKVLSSAGYVETMNLCAGQQQILTPEDPGNVTFVEGQMIIEEQPADLGHTETIIFYCDSERFHYESPDTPCDLRSGIICCPNNFQYDEPLPEGIIRLTGLANGDYWMSLPEDEYRQQKEQWFDRMVAAAAKYIPDYRGKALDTDVFTPKTIKHFTGHVNGCVYGAPQKRLDGTTHLENLYLCGTDQGYLGIVGSMFSGITIANLHLLNR